MTVGQFAKTPEEAADLALALTRLVEASNYGADAVDRPSFRVDNESLMPALDVLENTPYLKRDNDFYIPRLAAILEINNENTIGIVEDLNRILGLLVEHYRKNETRNTQKKLVDIANDLNLPWKRVGFCVNLLLEETWAWAGGSSSRTIPFDQQWIQPGENVLRHKTVEAMLPTLSRHMASTVSDRFGVLPHNALPKTIRTSKKPSLRLGLPSAVEPKKKSPPTLLTTFRRYEIDQKLGEGGSGIVYLVRDEDGSKYAAKIIRAGLDGDRRRRFKNELTFCSKQSHPNVVRVLDWGLADGNLPFYVMPFYESNLRKVIESGVTPDQAVLIFGRIADGVEAAHMQSVIHRDLKPENILCNADLGQLVIADFGIARFEEEDLYTAVETRKADRLANFRYAAPEQKERGAAVDHRADIFSLGLILNELFTSQVIQGVGFRKIGDAADSFAYLDPIVEKMVQQDQRARPNAIRDIKDAMARAGAEAMSIQRISALSNAVVPEETIESRHFNERLAVTGAIWRDGHLFLNLSYAPEVGWVDAFHRIGNFTSLMGKGPSRWNFKGDVANIDAQEHEAQQCIDHFKTYIPSADTSFRQNLERAASLRKYEAEERIRREREVEEKRLRINNNLRI
jgi:serine/threonine protein kinase